MWMLFPPTVSWVIPKVYFPEDLPALFN